MDSGPGAAPASAPWTVPAAGVGVALEGLVLLGFAVFFVVTGAAGFAVWGFFVLAGGGLVALGGALAQGARGARGPVVVVQILLLGVAYYAAVPSAQPVVGVPLALCAALIMVGVLSTRARAWAAG